MDTKKALQESLRKAEAELRRARKDYSTCLLNDPTGCAAEQQAVAAAERHVRALQKRLAEVRE